MRNYSIDTLKLICAIFVIFIHTPQPEVWSKYITPLMRCAVPIFFMISGYFSYGKKNLADTIHKRIIEQIKIFSWGFILYFIIHLIMGWKVQCNVPYTLLFNFIPNNYAHLWYILAYIYVLIVMLFVDKYNLYKILFCCVPILLIVALSIGAYSEILIGRSFALIYTRNWLLTGLPFFALGMMIKLIERPLMSYIPILISIVVFYIMGLFEITYLQLGNGDYYISTIFLSISIFLLFINVKQSNDNLFSRVGRKDSLYIYILHFFIAAIITKYNLQYPHLAYVSTLITLCLTLSFIALLKKIKCIGTII